MVECCEQLITRVLISASCDKRLMIVDQCFQSSSWFIDIHNLFGTTLGYSFFDYVLSYERTWFHDIHWIFRSYSAI